MDTAWIGRHRAWSHRVYVDASTHIPTLVQKHVLQTIHFRIVRLEYQLLGEAVPQHIWAEKPGSISVNQLFAASGPWPAGFG